MIPLVLQSVVGTHHLIFDEGRGGGVAQFFFARFFFSCCNLCTMFFWELLDLHDIFFLC